ncbi:VTC domain-containing protein [Dunaliella salina]|uniref:VTC domain-containing protein n=1 Tax=Dunaliella salina TaxID=3046 RepID=A0ABQ7G8A3_DUNSA|nr:VTC domain-containing protein [Dunaliella salina]|eukprot:KAF5830825.1 VTC domain-containing protein [Dunaliella salina]
MKYGQHLESKRRDEWKDYYIDYKGLKDLIKACAHEAETGEASFSPRTTSLTIARYNNRTDSAEEKFYTKLEGEVERVNNFTSQLVGALRTSLKSLSGRVEKESSKDNQEQLLAEAKRIGDEFLALEKYVNLNYMGFHKILKKHDKLLPHAPCRQFYVAHLHQQPWVQGNYSDLLVSLSGIYSKLRGDTTGEKNEDAAQGFTRSTTKYWVRNEDVSTVKHHVLQHLPVFQFDKSNFAGDAQLVNSVYLDNSSCELYHGRLDKKPGAIALRIRWYGNQPPDYVFVERKTHKESWKGEESVKERFTISEDKVVPFIDGEYTVDEALEDMVQAAAKKGKTVKEEDKAQFADLFTEVFNAVDSKQLRPFVRTQYMRTAFQIPFDATVRVSLDTNLCMIRENPEDGPTCAASGRWYRDPALPIHRTEITRFPHAVLEVKLSLPEGQSAPSWVQELLDSGYLTQVHKFSKFIHGSATLFPDMVSLHEQTKSKFKCKPSEPIHSVAEVLTTGTILVFFGAWLPFALSHLFEKFCGCQRDMQRLKSNTPRELHFLLCFHTPAV